MYCYFTVAFLDDFTGCLPSVLSIHE